MLLGRGQRLVEVILRRRNGVQVLGVFVVVLHHSLDVSCRAVLLRAISAAFVPS